VATIRFTYPRTGDEPTDRALDLIVSKLNQLVAGLGDGANVAEAIVDFGAAGSDMASVTVAAPWATVTSKIVVSITDDTRLEDALIDGVLVGVRARAAGSFVIQAHAPMGALGQFKVQAVGV
jgi:hypothetical protein